MGILIATGILLLIIMYMAYRNELVCRERIRIRKEIHNLEEKYIDSSRYKAFLDRNYLSKLDIYSYNKMLFQLFKFHWTLEDFGIIETPYNFL